MFPSYSKGAPRRPHSSKALLLAFASVADNSALCAIVMADHTVPVTHDYASSSVEYAESILRSAYPEPRYNGLSEASTRQ